MMKALLFLFLGGVAFAELPRLTVEHGERRQDLRVDEVEVTVRVEGDFVETRMSLNFFNETSFNQEGEFRLPLPEGASVNHYALEVEGRMRAATVVEKEQARHAYETIKARNIDPGLVEKMEGNIYRTRIFPVLPNKGKRVSIGYVQPLEKVGEDLVFRLPFGVAEKIGKFRLSIAGDLGEMNVELTGGAKLEKDEKGFSFSSVDAPVQGDLILKKKAGGGEFSGHVREVDGERFAYVTGTVPLGLLEQEVKKPEALTVVWDGSAGGYFRDREAEVAFLGSLVEELGEVSVRLMVVHGEVEDLGEFEDWETLRVAVEGIFHDGAADWRKVDFAKLKAERVLVFGGGESAFPIRQATVGGIMQMVRSGAGGVDRILGEMAEISGGGVIDLAKRNAEEAVGEVLKPRLRVTGVEGAVEDFHAEIVDGEVRIFAKLKKRGGNEVMVSLGRGGEVLMPVSVKLKQAEGGNSLRYLWAQRKLEELVRRESLIAGSEKAAIIGHCQKYGLVSDFTSLIVLERMEDHITFRIPPPEPELMAAYEKGLKEKQAREGGVKRNVHLTIAWQQRIRWHRTNFPWMDVVLLPRYQRVRKWTDAQIAVFEKEQLAQTNVMEFLEWRKAAEEVMRESGKIAERETFAEWMKRIDSLMESGEKLGAKDVEIPVDGEFGVSVRGLVEDPQTLSVKPGVTLREVIRQAGGIHSAGTEARVAVYRSGKRSVYNLLSEEYEDVKLLPGDMVVAMSEWYHHGYDGFAAADPFSDGSGGGDPATKPALVEGDLPLESIRLKRDIGPFGGDREATLGGGNSQRNGTGDSGDMPDLQGKVKEVRAQEANKAVIEEILKAEDLWAAYRGRRAEMAVGLEDFAKVAGKFYERKEAGKARRVLANFYASSGVHVPSLRAAAYWMMQYGDHEGAGDIFALIAGEFPEDALVALDVMRLDRIAGEESDFGKVVGSVTSRALAEPWNMAVAEMVMMERNRFQTEYGGNIAKDLPNESGVFPSDIRVVVSSSHPGDHVQLEVIEPTGLVVNRYGESLTGGRMASGEGAAEFMVRRALPGDYKLNLANVARVTYQVEVFLKWGSENETRRMFTISGDGKGRMMEAGVVEFGFAQD